ncbi:MAG: hypothetical protein AAFN92_06320 [Bacteroidota bacterium]
MSFTDHQVILNATGEPTGYIVPKADYDEMRAIVERQQFLEELETSLRQSFAEVKEIKAGKAPSRSLQSLIDEL